MVIFLVSLEYSIGNWSASCQEQKSSKPTSKLGNMVLSKIRYTASGVNFDKVLIK